MENLLLPVIAWIYQRFCPYLTFFTPFSDIKTPSIFFSHYSIMLRYFLEKYGLYCITAIKVIKTFMYYLFWTITLGIKLALLGTL